MGLFCSSIHSNKCVLHKRYITSAKIALPSVSARYGAAGRDGRAMERRYTARGDSAAAAAGLGSQSLASNRKGERASRPG
jgi:hypothetical protein